MCKYVRAICDEENEELIKKAESLAIKNEDLAIKNENLTIKAENLTNEYNNVKNQNAGLIEISGESTHSIPTNLTHPISG